MAKSNGDHKPTTNLVTFGCISVGKTRNSKKLITHHHDTFLLLNTPINTTQWKKLQEQPVDSTTWE